MNILLTSADITTPRITKALTGLHNNPSLETSVAIISTAAMTQPCDKVGVVWQAQNLHEYDHLTIDSTNPSIARVNWKQRVKDADVTHLSGANTFYVFDELRQIEIATFIKQRVGKNIHARVCAGSIIKDPTTYTAVTEPTHDNVSSSSDLPSSRNGSRTLNVACSQSTTAAIV